MFVFFILTLPFAYKVEIAFPFLFDEDYSTAHSALTA